MTACKTDLPAIEEPARDNAVTFVVGGDESATKAAERAKVMEPVDLSSDTGVEGLMLTETVTSLDGELFPAPVTDTKGTPVYTENFDAIVGGFAATAYIPKSDGSELTDAWGSDFGSNGTVQFNKTGTRTYSYNYSNSGATGVDWNLAWPEPDRQLLYFLQAPYATTSALSPKFYAPDGTHPMGRIEFDYTSPTSSGAGKDAEAQKDILFTSKLMSESTKDEDNHILFYHALTGVKIKAGNAGDQITTIKKVVFNNIAGTGHCVISPNYSTSNTSGDNPSNAGTPKTDASKSAQCALWTPGAANCSFTQTYSGMVSEYSKGQMALVGTVPDSFSAGGSALNNMNTETFTQTFMFIPQTLGANATMTVTYTLNEATAGNTTEYTRTVSLKDIVWKAGELHTYTITINDVRVDVDDDMSNDLKTKYNLTTINTGNVTAYLRCALVANWVYDDPETTANENVIVTACDIFSTGVFQKWQTGGRGFQDNWIVGSDGYIYYKKPVLPNMQTTYNLFYRYIAPSASPYKDAHLEIGIALQGVQFDAEKAKVSSAWDVGNVHAMTLSFSEPDEYGSITTTRTDSGQSILNVLETAPEQPVQY